MIYSAKPQHGGIGGGQAFGMMVKTLFKKPGSIIGMPRFDTGSGSWLQLPGDHGVQTLESTTGLS